MFISIYYVEKDGENYEMVLKVEDLINIYRINEHCRIRYKDENQSLKEVVVTTETFDRLKLKLNNNNLLLN